MDPRTGPAEKGCVGGSSVFHPEHSSEPGTRRDLAGSGPFYKLRLMVACSAQDVGEGGTESNLGAALRTST